MDLMTPEENDEFNRIERESATVRQEAIQASLWRKRQRLDEIDLLTNIVRDMSKRITELEEQLVRVDTLPVTTPTNSTKIEAALAQPEQDWIERERAVGYREGHQNALKQIAQPEQEPVAMKFKIYKPTVPDPMRQDINDALLPWVYDQSRGSGFVASMWVTPVSTLPPQRKEPEQWGTSSITNPEYVAEQKRKTEELRAMVAQTEQEPVGQLLEDAFGRGQVMWFNKPKDESMLYTTPPQRNPLTDEEILTVARDHYNPHQRPEISFARAIEAAHGIKE